MAAKGSIRRSQLVTTFGVGAIVPVEEEAFMVADLSRWNLTQGPDLHEPRLERELGVEGFLQPPSSDGGRDVPVVRFPQWQSCPSCRRLARHREFTHFDLSDCPECSTPLVPSRFVVACEHGHIDDFPYQRWVHRGAVPDGNHELRLDSQGTTASLAAIVIRCSCGAERTMEDAFDRFALRDVTSCTGRRPWVGTARVECDQTPRTLQRGGSSVWFSYTRSALSIPPWSAAASRALDVHWSALRHAPDAALRPMLAGMKVPEKTGFPLDELMQVAIDRRARETGEAGGERSLREEEYAALVKGQEQALRDVDFATRSGAVAEILQPWIAQLQLVTRLREVRALVGFSRIVPPRGTEGDQANITPLIGEERILPGIEVKGEGLFIRLDKVAVARWAGLPDVEGRVERLATSDRARHDKWGVPTPRAITGKLLLLHVFAHALITQLALDAGYPAGSLRERLYAGKDECGLLVYTATTDSAGSLGGLVSQGEPRAFRHLVVDAVRRSSWCSADPVCIESEPQGVDSLNRAACHSCVLLPETSCEEMNAFLDRALLVGTPSDPAIGFFRALLDDR
jgi:hypothetical protein